MSNSPYTPPNHLLSGHAVFSGSAPGTASEEKSSGDSGFSYTVPAALDLLAEMEGREALAQRHGSRNAVEAAELPMAQLRSQLKASARSRGQALAIDVVALLMEQVSEDARLLPAVREAIASAEPAYLDLALSDPRFFSTKNHPARRLLDVVTVRSLAFQNERASGYAGFLQDLRESLAFLLEGSQACDATHFVRALTYFEQQHARRRASADAGHERAVQVLLQAEERHLLAERLAAELRAQPDFDALNGVIADFLTGPWSQVMAQEKLARAAGSPVAGKPPFRGVLRDLLWSLDPEPSAQHRERLMRVIPRILATLREGLVFIDYPLAQSKSFFDELMALHQQALKQGLRSVLHAGPHPARVDPSRASHSPADFQTNEPWLAPEEVRQSGFLDVDTRVDAEQALPPVPPTGSPEAAGSPDLVTQLKLGTWVELVRDGVTVRAQLTWASPHNTLFMFSSAGGRTHSMTRRALLRLQQLGALKGLAATQVVENAFENAAHKALRDAGGRAPPQ